MHTIRRSIRPNHNKCGIQCRIISKLHTKSLPPQFTIWVDPFMVEYRIGEDGSTCILYEEKQLKLNVIPLNNNLWTVIKRFS